MVVAAGGCRGTRQRPRRCATGPVASGSRAGGKDHGRGLRLAGRICPADRDAVAGVVLPQRGLERLRRRDLLPVHRDDPLASIEGATNALVFCASPVGEVAITGPGAGPQLAGQGAFADLIAIPFTGQARGIYDAILNHKGDIAASMIDGQWAIAPPEWMHGPAPSRR